MSNIDFTQALSIKASAKASAKARAQAGAKATARALLARTDWMAIRAVETGVPVPGEISAERAAARLCLNAVFQSGRSQGGTGSQEG